jgi:hypothetical protein
MVTTLPARRHWAAPSVSEMAVVPGSPWLPLHGRISTRSPPTRNRYVGAAEPASQLRCPSPRSYELSVPYVWVSRSPSSVSAYGSAAPNGSRSTGDNADGGGAAEAADESSTMTAVSTGANHAGMVERSGRTYSSGSPRDRPRSMMTVSPPNVSAAIPPKVTAR